MAYEKHAGNYNQAVSLSFNHICTAVKFVVGEQMQPGIIKSVALKGVKNTGTYDMINGWTNISGTADFTQELNKETTGNEGNGAEITSAEGTFMMLPQTLPNGASVEVVFQDGATGSERTLSAPIGGTEWPIGKTVTYKLSITPEYELEFISEPELQDAHYVIYPIHIKAKDVPDGSWTLSSSSPEVTLRTDLTILTNRGYWIEEDRGTQSISSTDTGDDITVYAFLEENITDATRDVVLELRPTDMPDATPARFTISQLCPSWNGALGCERLEEYDEGFTGYEWGFLWNSDMKITYDILNSDLDFFGQILLTIYLAIFENDDFVSQDISVFPPFRNNVIIDFSKISPLTVATDSNDGQKNTLELYNFDGINDASSLMQMLEENRIKPDKTLPSNPTKFAARMCALKNKFNKDIRTEQGQQVEIAVLKEENLVWYLPAQNEIGQIKDDTYSLKDNYWTSTAAGGNDNENAYKFTVGGSTSLETRDKNLHVRAVRKKP